MTTLLENIELAIQETQDPDHYPCKDYDPELVPGLLAGIRDAYPGIEVDDWWAELVAADRFSYFKKALTNYLITLNNGSPCLQMWEISADIIDHALYLWIEQKLTGEPSGLDALDWACVGILKYMTFRICKEQDEGVDKPQ